MFVSITIFNKNIKSKYVVASMLSFSNKIHKIKNFQYIPN